MIFFNTEQNEATIFGSDLKIFIASAFLFYFIPDNVE